MEGKLCGIDGYCVSLTSVSLFMKDESSDLNKLDSIVIAVGTDDETVYSKSQAIQVWLLGLEMSDTLLVFTEKGIHVLASKKKIDYLKPLESSKENEKYVPPINLLVRNKVRLDCFSWCCFH